MNGSYVRGGLRSALLLTVVMLAGWAICFWPARYLRGVSGVQWMSIAAFCCLVPGWCVVFLSGLAMFRNELAAMMLHSGLRLFLVAGAALAVKKLHPELGFTDFYGWLVGFYLLALVVDVLGFWRQAKTPSDSSS